MCRIAEWVSHEEEREQQKADAKKQKKQKLERLVAKPNVKLDDHGYTNQLQETAERLQHSVQKGLASASESGPSGVRKRPAKGREEPENKRMKGW